MHKSSNRNFRNAELIFLIGFMGSGKTFLGRKLAVLLDRQFIDLDLILEGEEGKSISEIFDSAGEAYFREREAKVLRGIPKNVTAVVATGGGTPCYHEGIQWMNDHGLTVYLNPSSDILFERLKNQITHRPLLNLKSDDDLVGFIQSKLEERTRFYSLAHITVSTDDVSAEAIAEELKSYIK